MGENFILPTLKDSDFDNSDTRYFYGWKISGDISNKIYNDYVVTKNVKFVAEFIDKAVVNFIVDGEIIDIQYVKHGDVVTLPVISDTETKYYNGWKVDGIGESYKEYEVFNNTNLVLDMVNKIKVTFEVNNAITDLYVKQGESIMLPTANANTSYYICWKINGTGEALNHEYTITEDTKFVAEVVEINSKQWSGVSDFTRDGIWTDGKNIYYSYEYNQYCFQGL